MAGYMNRGATGRGIGARAFTLIELLVVLGVISLLAGILLPTLAGVRHFSKKVKCSSNLHSFGTSFEMYVSGNKDLLPSVRPFFDPSNPTPSDPALLEILSGYMNVNTPVQENPNDPNSPYIPVDPFFCPSDRNPQDEAGLSLGISYEYWPGRLMLFAEGPMFGDKAKAQRMVSYYWRDKSPNIPVLSDAKPWHKFGGGSGVNGLYYGDWHVADVETNPTSDTQNMPLPPIQIPNPPPAP